VEGGVAANAARALPALIGVQTRANLVTYLHQPM
jgi:hypothetical protein